MHDKYKVIVADPPWDYKNYKKPAHGAPQYKTMKFEDIAAIPTSDWADKTCLLVLWCTWPHLNNGIELVSKWGFNYVTGLPWVKTSPKSGEIRCGIGFWTQSASEVILIGRKGKVSPDRKNVRRGILVGEDRQFYAPIRKHSSKPEDIQDWIEARFEGPYLELFARREREKWDCWGLDTGYLLSENGVSQT